MLTAFLLLMTMAVTNVNAANMGEIEMYKDVNILNPQPGHTYKLYKIFDLQILNADTGRILQGVRYQKYFQTEAEAIEQKNAKGGYYYQTSIYNSETGNYDTVYDWSSVEYLPKYTISTSSPYYDAVSSFVGLTLSDLEGGDETVKFVNVENSFSAKDFVALILPIMEQQTPDISVTAESKQTLSFDLPSEGYYALNTTTGSMISTVHSQSTTGNTWNSVTDKNPFYDFSISVNDHDVEIGDVVKFTIKVDLPNDIKDFDEDYVYTLTNTIPEGLKFNEDVTIKGKYDGEQITWTNFMDNTSGTGTFYSTYIYASSPESATSGTTFVRNGTHYKPGFESSVYLDGFDYGNADEDTLLYLNSTGKCGLVKTNDANNTVVFNQNENSFTLTLQNSYDAPASEILSKNGMFSFSFVNYDLSDTYPEQIMNGGKTGFKIEYTCVVTSDVGVRNVEALGDQNLGIINTANLEYSCNPETSETKTISCFDRVRTADIVISSVLDSDADVIVPDGEYVLQNMDNKYYKFCESGQYYPFAYSEDQQAAEYVLDGPHIEWVDDIADADVFKPDENGKIIIHGLEPLSEFNVSSMISTFAAGGWEPNGSDHWINEHPSTSGPGMYRLIMTKKPTGYNALKEPVEVILTVEENTPTLDYPIIIYNNKGYLLPTTGEIGGLIMTVVGCIAVVALIVYLFGTGERK